MYKYILTLLLSICNLAQAEPLVIAAARASGQRLIADRSAATTEDFVHERYAVLVVNESGWRNQADINGIFQCIMNNSLPGKTTFNIKDPSQRARFVAYMALVGNRTFPTDTPWLGLHTPAQRHHHDKRQMTGNAAWTHALKTDCSKPDVWDTVYPDSEWAGYTTRCAATMRLTAETLDNKLSNWCRTLDGKPAVPRWWGGAMDLHRVEKNWEEIICDAPGKICTRADRESPNTPAGCAKNWYFRIRTTKL